MRLYTYFPDFDKEDNLLWHIHESVTDQVVASFFFEEDAQAYMHFLEDGGSFAGFTPSFMLREMPKGNINDSFAAEFGKE